jgi:hypothetical protein
MLYGYGKGLAMHVGFFGSGTNAENGRGSGNGRYTDTARYAKWK